MTQEDLKVQVKRWLKETRRTRQFLADRCGVELKTVNNWLSSKRPIPAKARLIIGKLIQPDAGSAEAPPSEGSVLAIHVDEARFDAYNRASLAEGLTIREWVLRALDEAAAGERVGNSEIRSSKSEARNPKLEIRRAGTMRTIGFRSFSQGRNIRPAKPGQSKIQLSVVSLQKLTSLTAC